MTPDRATTMGNVELPDGLVYTFGIGLDPCPPSSSLPWVSWRRGPDGRHVHFGYGWGRGDVEAIESLADVLFRLERNGEAAPIITDPRLQARIYQLQEARAAAEREAERERQAAAERRRQEEERRAALRAELRARAKGKMAKVFLTLGKNTVTSVTAWTHRGLAVHKTITDKPWESGQPWSWTVTHIGTGLRFGNGATREACQAFAVRAADLAPWEGIRTAKEADQAVRGQCIGRLKELITDPYAA